MIKDVSFTQTQGGVRLDAALFARFPSSTRALAREACVAGTVRVNGHVALKGRKLSGGERIDVFELAESVDICVAPNPAVRVPCVFEDEVLLAYDKPACLPVQPLSRLETNTLMNGVVACHAECAHVGDQPLMAGALHRIDADTSGLVLVARTQAAWENMRAQFAQQTVRKTYLALVEGTVATGGTLENDLVHDPTLPFCRMIDVSQARQKIKAAPLHAVTQFKPIGLTHVGNEDRTLLEVTIFTGVTHQIRAQLALAHMPIINDRLYGAFAVENQKGHCLHALSISLTHPLVNQPIQIQTSWPSWAQF